MSILYMLISLLLLRELTVGKIAIVIGATGVVGRELVTQLAAHDTFDKVISITRREINYDNSKIDNEVVNFERLELSKHLFKGDILFSSLGTTLKQAGSIEAQRKIDLEYQFLAAKLAADQGVTQYSLVSSSAANADSKSAYLKMKGELEQRVRTLSFKRITFVRPSLLLGKRSDFRLAEKIGACFLPIICHLPGLSKYRPITGRQVAKAMIKFSLRDGSSFDIFSLDDLFI